MDSDISEELLKGIAEFNRQEFFECHETLEDLWNKQNEPERQLTQGILQIAVGYYHLLRGNYEGSTKLFQRGLPRIKPFIDTCTYLDLSTLTNRVQEHLHKLQSGHNKSIDPHSIPMLQIKP